MFTFDLFIHKKPKPLSWLSLLKRKVWILTLAAPQPHVAQLCVSSTLMSAQFHVASEGSKVQDSEWPNSAI